MSKKKLVYIGIIFYIFFIFIPINLFIYSPNIIKSFLKINEDSDKPAKVVPNTQVVNIFEPSSITTPTPSKPRKIESYFRGSFVSCNNENCSEISLMEFLDDTQPSVQKNYIVKDDTYVFCVNRYAQDNDVSEAFLDFSNPLDSMYKDLNVDKIRSLQQYSKDLPVQFGYLDNDLIWISIYLDNCNEFN